VKSEIKETKVFVRSSHVTKRARNPAPTLASTCRPGNISRRAEGAAGSTEVGVPVVAEAGPFLEPKKENVARIVADCRATNQHVATPPRVPLPSLKQLTSIFKVPSLQVSR
jgi:hypothetical protein